MAKKGLLDENLNIFGNGIIDKNSTEDIISLLKLMDDVLSTTSCGMLRYREDDNKVLVINRAALILLGYDSKEEFENDALNGVAGNVFDEDKILIKNKIASLKAPGEITDVEYRVHRPEGKTGYIFGRIKLVSDDDGSRIIQRTLMDITEKKELELKLLKKHINIAMEAEAEKAEALAVSKERKAILMCLGKIFLDTYYADFKEDYIQAVSVECEEKFMEGMTEGSYDYVLKDYLTRAVHPDDREKVAKLASREYAAEHLSADEPAYSFYYRRLVKGCEYKWYRMYIILSNLDDNGGLEDVVIAFMNIDEERVKELKYRESLEKANKAKSQFLTNMSHDIRTPMNGIIGMTSIAMEHTKEPDKIEQCLNKINSVSMYLLGLINDMLDMSKIETGTVTLKHSNVNLQKLICNFANIIHSQVKEKGHKLTIKTDIKHTDVIADKLRVNQILVNVVSNAIKYTPWGGIISVNINEIKSENNLAYIRFVIEDNGIGISKEFLPKIFDMFTQEREEGRTEALGSGLGLAITKRLTELMNGEILAESQLGNGSVFTITIPFEINTNGENKPYSDVINVEKDNSFDNNKPINNYILDNLEGSRFLMAEDNELNAEIIVDIFGEKGAEIDVAQNGEEAVHMFNGSPIHYYDAVLMDIQMPVMNGYNAAKAIRELNREDAKTIPIIALSADAFTEDVKKAISSGMNAHVAKPVNFDNLAKILEKLLN